MDIYSIGNLQLARVNLAIGSPLQSSTSRATRGCDPMENFSPVNPIGRKFRQHHNGHCLVSRLQALLVLTCHILLSTTP